MLMRSRDQCWQCANFAIFSARKLKFGGYAYMTKSNLYANFGVSGVKLGSFGAFFEGAFFHVQSIGNITGSHFCYAKKFKMADKWVNGVKVQISLKPCIFSTSNARDIKIGIYDQCNKANICL